MSRENDTGETIPLTRGFSVLISREDYARVSQFKWHYTGGYARRTAKETGKHHWLHRFILNLSDNDPRVDHRNGNGLDCRRSNLRTATPTQNQGNKRLNKNNTTGFKGVCFDAFNEKFMASICINGKSKTIGRFDTAQSAADAYDAYAQQHFGEYALTNSQLKKEQQCET